MRKRRKGLGVRNDPDSKNRTNPRNNRRSTIKAIKSSLQETLKSVDERSIYELKQTISSKMGGLIQASGNKYTLKKNIVLVAKNLNQITKPIKKEGLQPYRAPHTTEHVLSASSNGTGHKIEFENFGFRSEKDVRELILYAASFGRKIGKEKTKNNNGVTTLGQKYELKLQGGQNIYIFIVFTLTDGNGKSKGDIYTAYIHKDTIPN